MKNEVLLKALDSSNPSVRLKAINFLNCNPTGENLRALEGALEDEDVHCCFAALTGINRHGHTISAETIAEELITHDQWRIRFEAISSIILLSREKPQQASKLLDALVHDDDARVKSRAVDCQSWLTTDCETEFEQDKGTDSAECANHIKEGSGIENKASTENPLPADLNSQNKSARKMAIAELKARTDPTAIKALNKIIAEDTSWVMRGAAIQALDDLSSPSIKVLIGAAKNDHWTVRCSAMRKLSRSERKAAWEAIKQNTNDPNKKVANVAKELLEQRGTSKKVDASPAKKVRTKKPRPEKKPQETREQNLPKQNQPANPIEAMLTAVESENEMVYQLAIKQLMNLDGSQDPTPLIAALKSESPNTRRLACATLENFEASEVEEALIKVLEEDQNSNTRCSALCALDWRRPDEKILEAIYRTTHSQDGHLKSLAAIVLGHYPPCTRTKDRITMLLADPDPRVREAAVLTLRKYPDQQTRERLTYLQQTDSSRCVRAAAKSVLSNNY